MDARQRWWRSTGTLARALMALLGVQAIGQLALASQGTDRSLDHLSRAIDASLNGRDAIAEAQFDRFSNASDTSFLQLTGLVSVAVLVVFIIWQWRSASNATALGRVGARISPGWVIAGWLVPVANLFVPYLGLQDLWRNTDPQAAQGAEWRRLHGSPIVTSFWITYFVGVATPFFVVGAVILTSVEARDTDSFTVAGALVYVASSVLGIFVVKLLTDRQEVQHASTPVAGSAPVWSGASSDGGAWHPDPLGRFEHRYWDGAIWTDWVSTNGQMSVDPERVPGYD